MASKVRHAARLEHIANIATRWIGSTSSLLVHSLLFIVSFLLPALHVTTFDKMLLVLTTLVSLEAIYLAIFIQMTVNKNSLDIENIQEDIEEIQEDVEEIQEDVEELQENADEEVLPVIREPSPIAAADQKLEHIQQLLQQLQQEIEALKKSS